MGQMQPSESDLITAIQAVLIKSIHAGVPGLAAVVASPQSRSWHFTTGVVDVEGQIPVDHTHSFGIGSITKVFVAVVILQLVDEMELKLTDTVEEILSPEIYHDIEKASQATVEGLLSHSAGIDSWEDDPDWIMHGRGKKLKPEQSWEKTQTLEYIRRPNVCGPKLGEWSYSKTNFTLLGLMIEKLTQCTAEAEIRRRILDPLHMNSTYLEGFEPARSPVSTPLSLGHGQISGERRDLPQLQAAARQSY